MRKDLLQAGESRQEGFAYYKLDPKKKTVLVTGGSLGAGMINKAIRENLSVIGNWKMYRFCGNVADIIMSNWNGN